MGCLLQLPPKISSSDKSPQICASTDIPQLRQIIYARMKECNIIQQKKKKADYSLHHFMKLKIIGYPGLISVCYSEGEEFQLLTIIE